MSAKLLLSLFPPARPFFRLDADWEAAAADGLEPETALKLKSKFIQMEKGASSRMYARRLRPVLYEVFKEYLVGGNSVLHVPPKGPIHSYNLAEYVTNRTRSGELLDLVIREFITRDAVPFKVEKKADDTSVAPDKPDDELRLHTVVTYTDSKQANKDAPLKRHYTSWQECEGTVVPGSQKDYTEDDLPWIVLRCGVVSGEDYGRSYLEDYLGDVSGFDKLKQTLVEGTAAAARVILGIRPGSLLKPEDLTGDNLSVIYGDLEKDVSVLKFDKIGDFRSVREEIDALKQDLAYAFLLRSAIQRNAERVTAEEIRYMAQELEATNGGLYSIIAADLQLPLARLELHYMAQEKIFPAIPESQIQPTVVTGFDAIGRGQDYQDLTLFLNTCVQVWGQDIVRASLKANEGMVRLANSLGIDADGLVVTEEELEAAAYANQVQKNQEQLVKAASPAINQQLQSQSNNTAS